MSNDDAWVGPWVADKISRCSEVVSVEANGNHLAVKRKLHSRIIVAALAKQAVTEEAVRRAVGDDQDVDFVVNVPKDGYLTGEALEYARNRRVALGGLGDLMRALRMPDVREYVHPTIKFIERGLRQHSRVRDFERRADLYYLIHRKRGLSDRLVVFLDQYELVAEHIRVAREHYGPFDIVVITNPNGKKTSSAESVAEEFGCQICMWGDFVAALTQR